MQAEDENQSRAEWIQINTMNKRRTNSGNGIYWLIPPLLEVRGRRS